MQHSDVKKILYSEVCGNGIEITVADLSRKIAGDRWLVRLAITVEGRMPPASVPSLSPDDLSACEGRCTAAGEHKVSKVFHRERNFVDDGERQGVVEDLLKRLQTTIFPYLRTSAAMQKLLAANGAPRYESAGRSEAANRFAHLDREEGPADFSSLFREK